MPLTSITPPAAGQVGELTAAIEALCRQPHPRPVRVLNLSAPAPDLGLTVLAPFSDLHLTSLPWHKYHVRELDAHAYHELVVCVEHDRIPEEDAPSLARFACDSLAVGGVFLLVHRLAPGVSFACAEAALLKGLPGGPRFPIEVRKDASQAFLVAKVRRVA